MSATAPGRRVPAGSARRRRPPAPRAAGRAPRPRSRREAAPPKPWPNPFRHVFLSLRFFQIGAALVVVFVLGFFWEPLVWAGRLGALALLALVVADGLLLWASGGGMSGTRELADKLSMGDDNPVAIRLASRYPFRTRVRVLDEVPVQFQKRDAGTVVAVGARGSDAEAVEVGYTLRPTTRGAYRFGWLHLFVATPIGLVLRRFQAAGEAEARVYPSILQMRRYAFLAASDRLDEAGVKRVRRVGQTMEFDQVRAYVPGDSRRAINWKATARRGMGPDGTASLYVNQYEEERAQPVVAALDMGRLMRSPFEGLTLLDHAINSSLVLLNTALLKHDQAGLVSFDHEVRTVLQPGRGRAQLAKLLESLYRQEASYRDPSYEAFYAAMRARVRRRALVLLFANFDTRVGLERQLPYLARIARRHRLVVVLFENTGIADLLATPARRLEDVYVKTQAESLAMEKREIARTLERHGIGSILTTPDRLTVDTVNRYLLLKSRGAF